MADVAATLAAWSSTTASNSPAGTATVGSGVDDNLRELQGVVVRGLSHKGSDIASAATTDIGAVEGLMHDITGTTTITSFGTVRAGILKVLKYEGALTLTHNSTSLILLGAENRTTANGDVQLVISEGSGNWRELSYFPVAINPGKMVSTDETQTLTNKTLTAPTLTNHVSFPASQSASAGANDLDDYEEGTWTPAVGGNATYTTQIGRYVKVGKFVWVWGKLTINVLGTGSATTISGLPFASANLSLNQAGTVSQWASIAAAKAFVSAYVVDNSSVINFSSRDATATSTTDGDGILGNSASVTFSIAYETTG